MYAIEGVIIPPYSSEKDNVDESRHWINYVHALGKCWLSQHLNKPTTQPLNSDHQVGARTTIDTLSLIQSRDKKMSADHFLIRNRKRKLL